MQKAKQDRALTLLRGLNPIQRQAVEYTEGPSLILAGAGSGKTKVLTHKVAYLISRKKISPAKILALTFTNKAAAEMRERISQLIKNKADTLWCNTFHSLCARLLRRDCEKLGFSANFAIYDEKDQRELIRLIIEELNYEGRGYTPNAILSKISRLKNNLITPQQFKESVADTFNEHLAIIYHEYQARLKQNNAMDFDDLLVKPIELFDSYPLVLQYYQNRWRYILVDEYQDTNHPQYVLLKLLSAKYRNISVVGDDDQSIYRWRGADIRNILEFENDFPDCMIFRLEQNYRSTRHILATANSVILNNSYRMEKELWTRKEIGDQVTLLVSSTGEEEAFKIVLKIKEEFHEHKRNFSDFAILYRTNVQSRALEDGLRKEGISYVIVGGVRFYERKEVKDILAYLRAICNPFDEISINRIINYPPRGIGKSTIIKIKKFCIKNNIPFIKGIETVSEIDELSEKYKEKVTDFYQIISKYNNLKESISAVELATTLVEELGILKQFKEEGTFEALNRSQNVRELLTTISHFSAKNSNATLEDFLAEVALITDIDTWDKKANAVSLMTLHSAKGLEFPVVFITGLEEGLLPLSRSIPNDEDLEEERRLFYVGATRAKEKLYLCAAMKRIRYGETFSGNPSRFLKEIKEELLTVDEMPVNRKRLSKASREKLSWKKEKKTLISKPKALKVGSLVKHPRFGKGVVRRLEGDGETKKAIIIFEELGEKKVVIQYAKLEII